MAPRTTRDKNTRQVMAPALSPEARENQLIKKSMDLVERQIDEGTASSQVLTHFLKMGSDRERLERERLESDNALLRAKIEQLAANDRIEALYVDAIQAMKRYSGQDDDDYDD